MPPNEENEVVDTMDTSNETQAPKALAGNRAWRRAQSKAIARNKHVSFQAVNAIMHGKSLKGSGIRI